MGEEKQVPFPKWSKGGCANLCPVERVELMDTTKSLYGTRPLHRGSEVKMKKINKPRACLG